MRLRSDQGAHWPAGAQGGSASRSSEGHAVTVLGSVFSRQWQVACTYLSQGAGETVAAPALCHFPLPTVSIKDNRPPSPQQEYPVQTTQAKEAGRSWTDDVEFSSFSCCPLSQSGIVLPITLKVKIQTKVTRIRINNATQSAELSQYVHISLLNTCTSKHVA